MFSILKEKINFFESVSRRLSSDFKIRNGYFSDKS